MKADFVCHKGTATLRKPDGFTLLEIIVTLILIAITGVVMLPVLRTNLTTSAAPVNRLDSQYRLAQEMEWLTARYRDEIFKDTLDINAFKGTYVDANPFVDAGNTGFLGIGQITGNAYATQSPNILRVTLEDGDHRMVAYFSE